ncbi:hypothetical protein GOODEAATRI_029212 [Goodea atripinnis]|uniref:Uncharacterized protein n=1 Tax=Goodea atripinnis TaxID=208336 RepID=A0ABV0NEL9_9TELE
MFKDDTALPAITKINKVAVITDGDHVTKITLFEEMASKICEAKNYVMRGYRLRGASPPYHILVTKNTAFFRSSPVVCRDGLMEEAKALLYPPVKHQSMFLYGEKLPGKLEVATHCRVTHLRPSPDAEGRRLQSTSFSKIEMVTTMEEAEGVEVVGVMDGGTKGMLEVLLANGKSYEVGEELWRPFEEVLEKEKLFVNLILKNNQITGIKALQGRPTEE